MRLAANKTHRMDVCSQWPKAVGARLARSGTPVAIMDGVLFVRAHTWGWVSEIGKHRDLIVSRVNELRGDGPAVRGLVVLNPDARLIAYHGGGKAS